MQADEWRKKELVNQRWRAKAGKSRASKTIHLCSAVLRLRELNRKEYFYGDKIGFDFDQYGYLKKINPNPTTDIDPANYFVGLKNLHPFPAHLKPLYPRKKVRELKKEQSVFLLSSKAAASSEAAKTGTFVSINNITYHGYDAIKKRLDEITAQLSL